jgi:hypothetical protein
VRHLIARFAVLFRKRLAGRVTRVNRRITEVHGYGASLKDISPNMTEADLEYGYAYEETLARLDAAARDGLPRRRKRKVRSGRGGVMSSQLRLCYAAGSCTKPCRAACTAASISLSLNCPRRVRAAATRRR